MPSDEFLAVEVSGVTKRFRVHSEKNNTLKDKVFYFNRPKYREFTAVDNVTLSIPRGRTVGLIGANGSGKSSLLKLISRILYPDVGRIEVRGRVASLLELGAGFHPDFTGRENIFINGALLGLSKQALVGKLEEIIAFSELGSFIDEPVRSYSSGMYMRLAFAVAVTVDPDVLLVDEILAVGDAPFQAKCMNRIRQLQAMGKTIVMVTHDMGAVEKFCDTVVWMHRGKVRLQGDPVRSIQSYLQLAFEETGFSKEGSLGPSGDGDVGPESSEENDLGNVDSHAGTDRWGTHEAEIIGMETSIEDGVLGCGEPLHIRVDVMVKEPIENVVFGVGFFSEDGRQFYGTNTFLDHVQLGELHMGLHSVTFRAPSVPLLPGVYHIDIAVHPLEGQVYDYWKSAESFRIASGLRDSGLVRIAHSWEMNGKEYTIHDSPQRMVIE